ncbi:MAG: hypothetical protein ACYC7J_07385 [Syntrophales bacterium]
MNKNDVILFSGGIQGAEAEFGVTAERFGIAEVNFSFEGHNIVRRRGLRVLTPEELQKGDVSLEYVSRLMNRVYSESPAIRKVLQSIWYQVNSGQEIYVIGEILTDNTVKGGTGWGAEFAKLCNKQLWVFDQERDGWFRWNNTEWSAYKNGEGPVISHNHITGTGTRFLKTNGQKAIADLFARSFA